MQVGWRLVFYYSYWLCEQARSWSANFCCNSVGRFCCCHGERGRTITVFWESMIRKPTTMISAPQTVPLDLQPWWCWVPGPTPFCLGNIELYCHCVWSFNTEVTPLFLPLGDKLLVPCNKFYSGFLKVTQIGNLFWLIQFLFPSPEVWLLSLVLCKSWMVWSIIPHYKFCGLG